MTMRLILLTATTVLLFAPSPAFAQGSEEPDDDLVVLIGHAQVAEDETVDTVVVFDGNATIDGTVRETVVVFNGPAEINGSVTGDVIAFNGTVTVNDGATIGGDLITTKEPVVSEGATIEGEIRRDIDELYRDPFPFLGKLAAWLAVSGSTFLLGLLLVLLIPRGLDRMSEAWSASTGASVGWGLLLLVGLPLVCVLLFLTVVGIPFGVGLMLALALIYATGYTLGAWIVGRTVMREPTSRLVAFLVGWAILRGLALIPFIAGLAGAIAVVIGLGVIAVAIWRSRRAGVPAAPATATP